MLRNAFDLLATEGTLRQILRQLTYAKTSSDQLRVNVDNQPAVTLQNSSTSTLMAGAAVNPQLWGSTSWNTVDARYAFGEQQIMNFIQNRERWTIS